MREIKFRSFCKPFGIMRRVSDLDFINSIVSVVIDEDRATQDCYSFGQSEIMQFTGLKDKNGVDIYEGDIIRILYTDWPSQPQEDTKTLQEYLISISNIGYIGQSEYGWEVFLRNKYNEIFGESLNTGRYGFIEVIGNIYEHPHLLPKEVMET